MPGLLLCFVLRYDNYKKQANGEVPGPGNMSGRMQRVSYFHCTLIGYFVGKQSIDARMDVKGQVFFFGVDYFNRCSGKVIFVFSKTRDASKRLRSINSSFLSFARVF